jgi:hypothetical protein
MNHEQILRRRIRWLSWFFIFGLAVSGATAIPLRLEVDQLISLLGGREPAVQNSGTVLADWLFKARDALRDTEARHPFLFYGTDWLAFGHFVIAIAFIGALPEPVRNRWLFDFGLIACVLVVPYALAFGALRGIPIWWRMIDCSFGIFGFIPLWLCRHWALELEGQDSDGRVEAGK